eukprot:tig00000540_g1926.t1
MDPNSAASAAGGATAAAPAAAAAAAADDATATAAAAASGLGRALRFGPRTFENPAKIVPSIEKTSRGRAIGINSVRRALGRVARLPSGLPEIIFAHLPRARRLAMLRTCQQTRTFALGASSRGWFDALFVPLPADCGPNCLDFVPAFSHGDGEGRWMGLLYPRGWLGPRTPTVLRYGPGGRAGALAIPPQMDFAFTSCGRDSFAIGRDGAAVLGGARSWLVWSPDGRAEIVDVGAVVGGVVACRPSPDASRVAVCSIVDRRILVRFVRVGDSAEAAAAARPIDVGPLDSDAARGRLSEDLTFLDGSHVDGGGLHAGANYPWEAVDAAHADVGVTWNAPCTAVLVRAKASTCAVDVEGDEDEYAFEAHLVRLASVTLEGRSRACWWCTIGQAPVDAFAVGLGENWLLHTTRPVEDIGAASMYVFYLDPPTVRRGDVDIRCTMIELRMPCQGWFWDSIVPLGNWCFIYQAWGQFMQGTDGHRRGISRPFLVTIERRSSHVDYFELRGAAGLDREPSDDEIAGRLRPLGAVGLHGLAVLGRGQGGCAVHDVDVVRYVPWPGTGDLVRLGGSETSTQFLPKGLVQLRFDTAPSTSDWIEARYSGPHGIEHGCTLTFDPEVDAA